MAADAGSEWHAAPEPSQPQVPQEPQGPLAGYVVVDFTQVLAGPLCTQLLADAGATVVKVEAPGGEYSRVRGHKRVGPGGEVLSSFSAAVNRGKHSIELDLKNTDGLRIALDLIESADVVVENFAPGVLRRLGISLEELREQRPELVTCSITLFGSSEAAGDLLRRKGLAIVAESESGFCSLQRHPDGTPVRIGIALGDMSAGVAAYGAVVTALLGRERTGVGAHVDLSMVKVLMTICSTALTGEQMESHELRTAGYGIYPTSDGYVAIGVNSDTLFGRLARVTGNEWMMADSRFAHYAQRDKHADEVNAAVAEWTSGRSAADVVRELTDAGVPGGMVATPRDILDNQLLEKLGYIESIRDGVGGDIKVPGNPYGYHQERPTISRAGADTDWVMAQFVRASPEGIASARSSGAFGPFRQ